MAFNSRLDIFDTGSAEGQHVEWLPPDEVAQLRSGDYPGKKVGEIAHRKRQKPNYQGLKQAVAAGEVAPATIADGELVDGHTRAAAHLALKRPMPVRRAPAV